LKHVHFAFLILTILLQMIIFTACAATTLAQYAAPAYPSYCTYALAEHVYTPTPYNFKYNVHDPHSYDLHSQSQYSDRNGNVKGSYSLTEADGSTWVVEYTTDDHTTTEILTSKSRKSKVNSQYYKAPYSIPAPCYKWAYSTSAYSATAFRTTPNKAY